MNKMLVFPIAVMFLISIIVFLETGIQPVGESENYSDASGIVITGSDPADANVSIPKAEEQEFNIWTSSGFMIIMLTAVAIGIVAGIQILGSGLSPLSQNILFNSIMYLGLWMCLTLVSSTLFFGDITAMFLWLGLTLIYMIGFSQHLNKTDG